MISRLLTIENRWALILLLAIPYLWWSGKFSVAGLSPKHLNLSAAIRSTVIAFLVLALAQPVFHWHGSAVSVVYLLDVSQSVSASSIQSAIQWIRDTNDAGKPSEAGFIAFASNSLGFHELKEMTQVPVSAHASPNAIDQSQTNIAAAVERAIRGFAPNPLKRLVLMSDGNENSGSVASVIPRLKQEGIEVFTVPMGVRPEADVWLEDVVAPPKVNTDEEFPLEARVYSQSDTDGRIEIRNGPKVLKQSVVRLKKGINRIGLETSIPDGSGTVVLEVEIHAKPDAVAENNVFRQTIEVLGKPKILYAEGHAASSSYLRDALSAEGFNVTVIDSGDLPQTVEEFAQYDAVVISDVNAKSISEAQMQAVNEYVRELGGGFILAGGENVFGEKGYSGTTIAEALPVTFEVKKPLQSVSIIVILDKSGSMAGDKIRYAKEATKAPLALLKDTDHFGVLTFNFNAAWVLHPQPIADRVAILKAIDEIGVGGETNLYPAMKEAFAELQKETDQIKHVIILSDGRTLTDDFPGLTKQMADARITVSTVSVGQEADRELMAKIASLGGGKTFYAEDPAGVPQIFNKDLEDSVGEAFEETAFKPIVTKQAEAFKGIDFQSAPKLLGYVQTKAKASAEVLLEAHHDKPLLARWQYGLGKAVVFTSDVKDRWAVDWLKWKGYSKFWSQIVRESMRRQDDSEFDFRVRRDGESAVLYVDSIGKEGHFQDQLHIQAHVLAPDRTDSLVDIPQIGPGAYEARVPLMQNGTYLFRLASNGSAGASRMLAYSYPEEYRSYPPDTERLRMISKETGGVFEPTVAEIFDTRGQRTDIPIDPVPWLIASALGLFVIDVILRRFRLFEQSRS